MLEMDLLIYMGGLDPVVTPLIPHPPNSNDNASDVAPADPKDPGNPHVLVPT